MGIATAILVICQAWLLSHSVVSVFEHRTLAGITWMLPALAAVFLGRGLLAWLNSWLAHRASAAVKSQLRRDILAARLARPATEGASASTLVGLVTHHLDALDGYFSKYLPQLALAMVVPFMVGGTILWADWKSAFIVAFTLPLIPIFMALIGWTTKDAVDRRFAVADRLANHFGDLVEGLPTLQVFGRAQAQLRGVRLTEEANHRETMRTLRISFVSALVLELLASLSVAVVAVTVGFRLVFGHVDFATALFVLVLAPEAYLPVRQVGVHFHDSADGVAAADAAFAIIDEAGGEDAAATAQGTTGPGASGAEEAVAIPDLASSPIRFEDVSFTHPGAAVPTVSELDLEIAPGQLTALIGPSGVGKTTALRLLMAFERPSQGRLLVGERDLNHLDAAAWRRRIAFVAQDPGMVVGSVADNVRLGLPEATDAEVAEALREVSAGFSPDRSVGEDGEGLSAGERRRVALARALVRVRHGAQLLVLDEPTAGLDAETEARVITAVRQAGVGGLVISHRDAVVALADHVVQMTRREVAPSGDGEASR